ncbi:Putative tyrosyl-DNA phosphodiesterase [Gryllus bimaculatus]|nr:Putative tyrosyl-DNA phosphodiesterase [Gryllus bimaculatus]
MCSAFLVAFELPHFSYCNQVKHICHHYQRREMKKNVDGSMVRQTIGIPTGPMDIPPNKRPNCNYGNGCYRRNPIHLREYCHPHLEDLLQGQKSSSSLELPENYKPNVDKELILDQLNVLKRIYEKLAEKPPVKKSKLETASCNVSAKSSEQSNASESSLKTKILPNVSSLEKANKFSNSSNSSSQLSRPDSARSDSVSESSSARSETSNERAGTSSFSSQSDSRRFDNFRNMKQKCRDLKRKSMAEAEKSSKSPFSSDIPSRIAAAAPYFFFLTKVRAEPRTYHEPFSITFRELLDPGLGDLRASLQINFLVELPWVMHHYKHQGVDDKPLLILHGEDSDDLKKNNLPPNITAVRIKTPHPFGHHHTKMSLFHYEDGSVRVVVSTANLVASDWHNRTQGLWISPACPELPEEADTKAGDSPTEFKTDLLRYLCAYQIPELQEWVSIVRQADFSEIRVCFIGTVPGTHRGPDMDRWGHRRLAAHLKKHAVGVDPTWSVVAQCSSIGSLGTHPEAWMLDELRASMTLGKGTSMIQGLPPFKVIYPSKQNVYDSVDGALGGDCLPYSMHTHSKQTWFTSFLYQWKSDVRFRTKAVPHIKTYTRMSPCGSRLAWFHLSSANLSKAAWGMNKKTKTSGTGVFMMSYEAGVLFLPEILINKPVFSVGKSDDKTPPFPLPYDAPLTRYNPSDKPWVMEYLNEYMRSKK